MQSKLKQSYSISYKERCINITELSWLLCFCNCGFGDTFGGAAGTLEAAGDGWVTAAAGLAAADSTGNGGKPTQHHTPHNRCNRIQCDRIWMKSYQTCLTKWASAEQQISKGVPNLQFWKPDLIWHKPIQVPISILSHCDQIMMKNKATPLAIEKLCILQVQHVHNNRQYFTIYTTKHFIISSKRKNGSHSNG